MRSSDSVIVPSGSNGVRRPPDAGKENGSGRRWYACHTRARSEKRVAGRLLERSIPALLPLVTLSRQWADRRRAVEFPLFPGYVFARFALTELHEVLSVPGVATVVRFGTRPVPIRADEIENIERVAAGFSAIGTRPDPHAYAEGQAVRVIDGPFRGVRGIVVRIRGRHRVLAGLHDIDLAVSIDVDKAALESI